MDKFTRLKRLRYILDALDSNMRAFNGQLKVDAQEDIKALEYAIKLIEDEVE